MNNPSMTAPCRPVVLLDRDGTVIINKHYLHDPAEVEFVPGAAEGLRQLGAVAHLALVSNQSGIGRGYFTAADLAAVNARLVEMLKAEGVQLFGLYHCPHGPDEACACRKPGTAMAEQALHDLSAAGHKAGPLVVVGDNLCDVDLALALDGHAVLVRTGHGQRTEAQLGHRAGRVLVADDLLDAARRLAAVELAFRDAGSVA